MQTHEHGGNHQQTAHLSSSASLSLSSALIWIGVAETMLCGSLLPDSESMPSDESTVRAVTVFCMALSSSVGPKETSSCTWHQAKQAEVYSSSCDLSKAVLHFLLELRLKELLEVRRQRGAAPVCRVREDGAKSGRDVLCRSTCVQFLITCCSCVGHEGRRLFASSAFNAPHAASTLIANDKTHMGAMRQDRDKRVAANGKHASCLIMRSKRLCEQY